VLCGGALFADGAFGSWWQQQDLSEPNAVAAIDLCACMDVLCVAAAASGFTLCT
jgi:hypothetical protein